MEWKDLSRNAQNVIEWVQSPLTNRYHKVQIQVGKTFLENQANIDITQELFGEIVKFIKSDKNMQYELNTDKLEFQFTDEYKKANRE